MKTAFLFCAAFCVLGGSFSSRAASSTKHMDIHFEVDRNQQLGGRIDVGYLSLGGTARLPVQLEHYVRRTLHGDISMFSISPIETYLTPHPSMPEAFLWRSPLGNIVAIPRPPLGFYTAENISYRFANDLCTIGLPDGCSLVYHAGLLEQLVLADGAIIDCESTGRNLITLCRDGHFYLRTNRDHDSVTIFGFNEAAVEVAYRFEFNRRGQIVSFNSPSGIGSIEYDSQGLISGASSPRGRVAFKNTAVNFWDYKKRQLGLERNWSIEAGVSASR